MRPAPPPSTLSPTSRPNIRDVAARAGVSKASVSQAMNWPAVKTNLKPETRERIVAVAREMGYQPNWRGKALTQGRTQTIAVVYDRPAPFAGPSYGKLADAFATTLQDEGYNLQFVPWSGSDAGVAIEEDRFDAIVAMEPISPEMDRWLSRSDKTAALLNARRHETLPTIGFDDEQGARDLARHLLELGHREAVFFLVRKNPEGQRHFSVDVRYQTLRDAFADAGGVCHREHCEADEFVARLAEGDHRSVTAAIAWNPESVLPLLHALWSAGITIPDRLSVATFDDLDFLRYYPTPITTVATPFDLLGRQAALAALDVAGDRVRATPPQQLLPMRLIARHSSGAAA